MLVLNKVLNPHKGFRLFVRIFILAVLYFTFLGLITLLDVSRIFEPLPYRDNHLICVFYRFTSDSDSYNGLSLFAAVSYMCSFLAACVIMVRNFY